MRLRRKDNGIWMLDYEVDGDRRRVSTGTRDHAEAKLKAQEIISGKVVQHTAKPKALELKVRDLLRHCMLTIWRPGQVRSYKTLMSNIKLLEELLGDVALSKLTHATMQKMQLDMEAQQYRPGTIKRRMDTLYRALKEGLRWDGGTGTGIPVLTTLPDRPPLVVDNFKDRVVSPEEYKVIMTAIEARARKEQARDWHRFAVLVQFLHDTGCRLSEALQLHESRVEVTGEADQVRTWVTFPIYSTKNKKPRRLPLTQQLAPKMPGVIARAIDGRVFPILPQTVWYMWDTIRSDVKKLGGDIDIDDVTLHTFRHTCITALAKKLPLQKVSVWAGHSSINITMQRYAHLQSHDLIDCVDTLDA